MDADQFQRFMGAVGGGNSAKPPKLKETTPAAFRTWRRQFENIADHRQWDDQRVKLEASCCLEEKAAQMTGDLRHDVEGQTPAQYLDLLQNRYKLECIVLGSMHESGGFISALSLRPLRNTQGRSLNWPSKSPRRPPWNGIRGCVNCMRPHTQIGKPIKIRI